jgi:hypothetical protein
VCAADDSLLGTSHADRFEHLQNAGKKRASLEHNDEKSEAQERLALMKKKQSKRIMEEARLKLRSGSGAGGGDSTGEDEEASRKKALGVLMSSPNQATQPVVQYTYAELKTYPAGVDRGRMQDYLLESEFEEVFGMAKAGYNKLAGWKQKKLKKEKGLM